MDSVWLNTTQRPMFESLKGDIKTDVLIIGGGLTGILCAYMLKQAGVDYVLCEADRICSGITKNTTAKVTFQHGLIYDELIRKFGIEKAKMYLEANRQALKQYAALCKTIDCGFEEKDSFVYSLDSRRKIENEVKAFNKLGVCAEFVSELPLPFKVEGAVKVPHQGQFHPLKFSYALAKDLNIYENTKVLELKPNGAVTNHGRIAAKKIVVATHFPLLNKHGSYFLKLYQHRSYVLALKNAPDVNGMYVDEQEKGMSFRNYGDLLFVGGGSHRTGKKGGNWQELERFAAKYYPNAKEAYRWATQDCMSLDGVPYIGQYSKNTPNLFVASGYNKWGFSSSMAAANILTDMVQGKRSRFAEVFSPSRSVLHPQLAVNAFEAVMNILTPTAPRCPHLGCALKYNKQEHSWDCPCHGSRFTEKGKLIDNPATDDLNKKT
ncbi:MAG: FAD-dependent oxidoreductase [Oscillospiraceae bacterium]|nr:FAD-dependent oxidoreductase [Oscillospiraceae bacterium]MBQ8624528.1 FAD-dependent oxidoreductase [Oscillospiraceae bacterium]